MLVKLALRNVKRQFGNYLIYFLTVALTVALMFSVNSAIFSKQLTEQAKRFSELRAGLIGITAAVSLIVAFVLGYATSFMLKLRKREFGAYLTLGMTRRNILLLFVAESLILYAVALGIGILLGLFMYQGVMAIVMNLTEVEFSFAAYSLKGLLLTVFSVSAVFLLSSLTSAMYLRRTSICDLLHGDKKVEKRVKYPVVWSVVTVISLILIVGSCFAFSETLKKSFGGGSGLGFLVSLAVLGVAVVFFHIGLARSIVDLLLKNKRFKCRGTNTFTLRQLSGKLGGNSVMIGALAFLLAFAVIGANVSFVQKAGNEASLKNDYPFDIEAELSVEEPPAISFEQAEEIIGRYATIEKKLGYSTYTEKGNYLHGFTRWSGAGYEGLYDTFMTESDFNRIYGALGFAPVDLKGGFKIFWKYGQTQNGDFSVALLDLPGGPYSCKGMISDYPKLSGHYYFVAVVPDEAVEGMQKHSEGRAYELKEDRYDSAGLEEELSYSVELFGGGFYRRCDFGIREEARKTLNASSAVFVVAALYLAIVFIFLAMAILAVKTLSGLSDDKRRYEVLHRLGASRKAQSRTLFVQICVFFFFPFAVPLHLSIPTAMICAQIMRFAGFPTVLGAVFGAAGGIAFVLAAIYILYFTATYLIAKKYIVKV